RLDLLQKGQGLVKELPVVPVQPEHEVQGIEDALLPQATQEPFILRHRILHLVDGGDGLGADVFDADVDVVAAGAFGQVQQFFVPGAVDGPQAAPVELQRQQGLEQLLGVFQVAGEVVVDEIEVLEAGNADVGPDFFDHFVQGPPAVGVPVNDGNLAKGAVIRAAAGGLGGNDFHAVAPEIHQFQAGPGQARQMVQPLGLVTPLQALAAGVLQDLLP